MSATRSFIFASLVLLAAGGPAAAAPGLTLPDLGGVTQGLRCTVDPRACRAAPAEPAGTPSGGDASEPDEPAASPPAEDPGVTSPEAQAGLDPDQPPSVNFDLSRWYLTLPSGSAVSVAQLNDGYTLREVFETDPQSGGMVFRCPNLAGTTANSQYSRTELREMRAGGGSTKDDANNWKMDEGGTLTALLRVDQVSTTGEEKKVGRVIIGQIHGVDSEPIRLYYTKRPGEDTGRIHAGLDTADNASTAWRDIVPNAGGAGIELGETFGYRIRLLGRRLTVRITRPDGTVHDLSYDIDPAYAGENLYFKAGVYNQNNTGSADDYVQATFFALDVTHP